MNNSSFCFVLSSRLFTAVGVIFLLSMTLVQVLQVETVANNGQDQFPDRRQGGGTHWVLPHSPMYE